MTGFPRGGIPSRGHINGFVSSVDLRARQIGARFAGQTLARVISAKGARGHIPRLLDQQQTPACLKLLP
ncbi:hypothetical protein ACFWOJ_24405 [Streptomyces sp. NPDC058439]|uniref:hypothetical protein n=1 Tax=Streptomyces sp. NPDC058439 TaxID=3346500 RepID=UPI00365E7B7A